MTLEELKEADSMIMRLGYLVSERVEFKGSEAETAATLLKWLEKHHSAHVRLPLLKLDPKAQLNPPATADELKAAQNG